MFAYCFNNPVACADPTGRFPWLLVTVLAICTIVGGILGASSDKKLGPDANEDGTGDENQELTFGDRVMNTIIGASFGLATGGAIMAFAGVVATCVVGSGVTTIGLFGATGLQTMAQGALAFDFVAIVIGPFIGAEMEPIEYE